MSDLLYKLIIISWSAFNICLIQFWNFCFVIFGFSQEEKTLLYFVKIPTFAISIIYVFSNCIVGINIFKIPEGKKEIFDSIGFKASTSTVYSIANAGIILLLFIFFPLIIIINKSIIINAKQNENTK